jgi:DNA-binding YbaB/EbfC family protein
MSLGDMMKMMQQAQEMQGRLQQIQDELALATVTGAAGGGLVSVDADGKGMVKAVRIDKSVVTPDDVEMLEDLLTIAIADAQTKAAAHAQQEMAKLTGGLNLPFKLPF